MMQDLKDLIRWKLLDYLEGRFTLRDLRAWLASETWDIHATEDPDLIGLVGRIELALAEYSLGHISRDEMREEFQATLELQLSPSLLIGLVNDTFAYA